MLDGVSTTVAITKTTTAGCIPTTRVCVCVCCEKEKNGVCPLSIEWRLYVHILFNQVVTVSFPLILCNNLYYSQCIHIHICHVSRDHNLTSYIYLQNNNIATLLYWLYKKNFLPDKEEEAILSINSQTTFRPQF